jgi:DNA-binding transcriptional ArsR family regulator
MQEPAVLLALSALAQPTRLRAFQRLVRAEPKGISVGKLAQQLSVPQNTLSTHLAILSRAGLIAAERQERSILYRPQLKLVSRLTVFLLKDCCGGRPELCEPVIAELTSCCKPRRSGRAA